MGRRGERHNFTKKKGKRISNEWSSQWYDVPCVDSERGTTREMKTAWLASSIDCRSSHRWLCNLLSVRKQKKCRPMCARWRCVLQHLSLPSLLHGRYFCVFMFFSFFPFFTCRHLVVQLLTVLQWHRLAFLSGLLPVIWARNLMFDMGRCAFFAAKHPKQFFPLKCFRKKNCCCCCCCECW